MDMMQMLPLLMGGKLGEKEQELLKLTQNPDKNATAKLLAEMYAKNAQAPKTDTYALLKKIIPAEILGRIIKYFDGMRAAQRIRN